LALPEYLSAQSERNNRVSFAIFNTKRNAQTEMRKVDMAIVNPERRASRRILCSSLVGVTVCDGSGAGAAFVAIANDISEGGMCLQMDGPLPECHMVKITAKRQSPIEARVRYISRREESWFIGVEFSGYRWNNTRRWPEHRIDTTQLVQNASKDIPARIPLKSAGVSQGPHPDRRDNAAEERFSH